MSDVLDPVYSKVITREGYEASIDTYSSNNLPKSPPGSLPKVQPQDIVLVLTGGMNPCHSGHVKALYSAKKRVEDRGDRVGALILVPDHSEYIQLKANKNGYEAIDAVLRIQYAVKFCKEFAKYNHTGPIYIWGYPALRYPGSVMHTMIWHEIQEYYGPDIRVEMVFGSDNEHLVGPFYELGIRSHVIERTEESSTKIQKSNWKKPMYPKGYTIRVLEEYFDPNLLGTVIQDLQKIAGKNILVASSSLHCIPRMESVIHINKWHSPNSHDVFLNVSRIFDSTGVNFIRHTASWPSGKAPDIRHIQCVYDSDSCTGDTIRFVEDFIGRKLRVFLDYQAPPNWEIIDLTDLVIPPKTSGGLVVEGRSDRVSYLDPSLLGEIRMSIPKELCDKWRTLLWKKE